MAQVIGGDRLIRMGPDGAADISGILNDGRRLEIEVKGPGGKQRPQQKKFQEMVERFGGVYILARSVGDAVDGIRRAIDDRIRTELMKDRHHPVTQ